MHVVTNESSLDLPDAEWVQAFRRRVRHWYRRHGRNLPWRGERDPYRVWVREVMLQQTTVTAVVPFLARFLERFPRVETLATAGEEDVLKAWEGLGYYSRARNLHRAARVVVEDWGGLWPEDVVELRSLPGVGPYTAGAIMSFAMDQASPIVEANTLRLYARLTGMTRDPRRGEGLRQLWSFAERIVPRTGPGEFNQALMDLGATVCGDVPDCLACPVRSCCTACERGEVGKIPVPTKRVAVTDVYETAVIVKRDARVLLLRHPEGKRWAGLWDFPRFETGHPSGTDSARLREIEKQLLQKGIGARVTDRISQFQHAVTRFRIHLDVVAADWTDGERLDDDLQNCWQRIDQLEERALSNPGRRIATAVQRIEGGQRP